MRELIKHIIILGILIFALLFVLVYLGYLRCCDIPGFCSIYYYIVGYPSVAIVYGNDGIGDPQVLRDLIVFASHGKIWPMEINLDFVTSSDILEPYSVVIVERAKTMSTAQLRAFADYVLQKKGTLIWIGDAGTSLGKDDYICEKITFAYRVKYIPMFPPSQNTSGNNTGNYTLCSDWKYYEPNIPKDLEGGICGKTFGEVVKNYWAILEDVKKNAPYGFCQFQARGGERIEQCLHELEKEGKLVNETSAQEIEQICSKETPYSYWKRGPTKTKAGTIIPGIDFGTILGAEYVGTENVQSLSLYSPSNYEPWRSVYPTQTVITWPSPGNVSIVDVSPYTMRSTAVVQMYLHGEYYPAVVVSNPFGPQIFGAKGKVFYFAYPPEYGFDPASKKGTGVVLMEALLSYLLCPS